MESAVIVRTWLPIGLEALRRRNVADATHGVPAHVTLLYPFVAPSELTAGVRSAIAEIADGHPPFGYQLSGPKRWPDTIYAAVTPNRPFLRMHGDLARAFPAYPIYGQSGFALVPHVTIAEGEAVDDPTALRDRAWANLPVTARAEAMEVIASDAAGRWRLVWRLPLGHR